MGAKGRDLVYMILFQAVFTSLVGYGLSRVTYTNLGFAFLLVLVIASISSYAGVRRVLRVELFDIFRG
jgi:putative ABC transport system permease protein